MGRGGRGRRAGGALRGWAAGAALAGAALAGAALAGARGAAGEGEAAQPPMTEAEMKDLNKNPTPEQREQQREAFGELVTKLEGTLVDPRGAGNYSAWEWVPSELKFVCPEGAECAPRLTGVELISLAMADYPGLKGSPVDPSIESMTRHLGGYIGDDHGRDETIDMLALYSAIDHQTGTSGDLPKDFAAVKKALFKTTFMTPHKSRPARVAHQAALQEYLVFAELLRFPAYDWRPLPAFYAPPGSCALNETLVMVVPNIAARSGEAAAAERREIIEAATVLNNWRIEFPDASDGHTVRAASEEDGAVGEDAASQALARRGLGLFRGWRLAEDDPKLRTVPHFMVEMPEKQDRIIRRWARDLAPGDAGRALAHLRAWEEALARDDLSETIFLEDDLAPLAGMWCALQDGAYNLNYLKVEWDVIFLQLDDWYGDAAHLNEELGVSPHFSRVSFAYGSGALMFSARGLKRVLEYGLGKCMMPIDEYLAYLTNPSGHPRGEALQACLGLEEAPADFVALRWRGKPVVGEAEKVLEATFLSGVNIDEEIDGSPEEKGGEGGNGTPEEIEEAPAKADGEL